MNHVVSKTQITREIPEPLAAKEKPTTFYNYGLDVAIWLTTPSSRPPLNYLASIPVLMHLISLIQLVQYLVVCRVQGITPGDLRGLMSGATGHSRGMVSALAIATSSSFNDLTTNAPFEDSRLSLW